MTYNKGVLDECEPGCAHEPWLGVEWETQEEIWHLCPVYLATEGRGRAWRIEPLVFANYDDDRGIFMRANEVDGEVTLALAERHGYTIKEYVPVICAWPTGHYQACGAGTVYTNGTSRTGAQSIHRVDLSDIQRALPEDRSNWWPFGNNPPPFSWFQTGLENLVFYGVCRRHLPDVLGVKPMNRSYTKVRDFQRSRVYKWEGEVFPSMNTPSWTLDDSRELVHTIWDAHAPDEIPPPQVSLGKSKRKSDGCRERIRLHPNHLNPIVVVHETAHGLLSAAGSGDRHGPLFVRMYLELLERYAGETPEPAENLKVASYQELAAVERLRGFEIAEKAAA